jgi:hypothetical protein
LINWARHQFEQIDRPDAEDLAITLLGRLDAWIDSM